LGVGWSADSVLVGPDLWKPPSPVAWYPPAPWEASEEVLEDLEPLEAPEPWEVPDPGGPPEPPGPLASMRYTAASVVPSPGSPAAGSAEAGAVTDPRSAVASSSDFKARSSFAVASRTRLMVRAAGRLSNEGLMETNPDVVPPSTCPHCGAPLMLLARHICPATATKTA
jgi:hypothetical protein